MAYRVPDFNFPEDFYLDDVGVWRLKKEKLAELENPRPVTNEEWIRSCNTEQLAEFLVYVSLGGYCGRSYGDDPLGDVSHWLSEPHKEAHQ